MRLNIIVSIFALEKIDAIKGKQEFVKLKVDDKCPFDEFENSLEKQSKHLRVYGITMPNGKIIITGGTKASQKDDQNMFRKVKAQYLESIKSK